MVFETPVKRSAPSSFSQECQDRVRKKPRQAVLLAVVAVAVAVLVALLSVYFLKPSPPQQESDVRYIQNDKIKLGVDLLRGGSITYLSEANNSRTVINHHDQGREVQMSFYAAPNPYNPPTVEHPKGACNKLFMGVDWPWNPIGAGDVDGNHGQILSFSTTSATSLHVLTRPLQWACHNVSCECTFEQDIELIGDGVKVTSTLRTSRKDVYTPILMDQELPAVYSNGEFYRLLSYSGEKPVTGDDMVTEYDAGWKDNFWSPGVFSATEHWAALLDKRGWGLGVINAEQTNFLGGFHGRKGRGGPNDDPVGYIAPVGQLAIGPTDVCTYSFFLVLGDLKKNRAYAYDVQAILVYN